MVVASGDSSEVLEPTEGILDAVALFVGFLVEAERLLAVGLVGNDDFGAAILQPLSQWRAVISLVAEKLRGSFDATDQARGKWTIVRLSFCRFFDGFFSQPSGSLPALTCSFSSRLLRCRGTGTIVASTIWPPRAM